jgi:voltage-gated potassium channel Kch
VRFALALPQGSEFGFVLFAAAVPLGALSAEQAVFATVVAAASMATTPLLFAASERWLVPRLKKRAKPAYEVIETDAYPVIICGFGRMGQVVGRILRMSGIRFTALDRDPARVEVARRFGTRVFYGDAGRLEVLRAAGAAEARVLVLAMDDADSVLRTSEIAQRNFPNLRILARARDRQAAHLLLDRGVDGLVRETFHSTLKLTELALKQVGMTAPEAARTIEIFRTHDEAELRQTQAFYRDEKQLVQSAQQAADELASLFEADERTPSRTAAE